MFDQRDRDRPVGTAGNKGAGAVDRIDDPGRRHRAAGEVVFGFFRQPAGVGRERGEAFLQQIVDGDIGVADRRVVMAFGPALEVAA